MHVYIPIVPCIFVPCTDNTALTLQWRGNNGVAQLGLKGHDNKCDKPQSDAGHRKKKEKKTFHPIQMWTCRVKWITDIMASERSCQTAKHKLSVNINIPSAFESTVLHIKTAIVLHNKKWITSCTCTSALTLLVVSLRAMHLQFLMTSSWRLIAPIVLYVALDKRVCQSNKNKTSLIYNTIIMSLSG